MDRNYSPVLEKSKEEKIAKEFEFIEKFLSFDTKGMKKTQKNRIFKLIKELKFYAEGFNIEGAKQVFLRKHSLTGGNYNNNELIKVIVRKIIELLPKLRTFKLQENLFAQG